MLALKEIEKEILTLSQNEFSDLRKWFNDIDAKKWDKEIENDSSLGELDFLINEALLEKNNKTLTDL